MPTIIKQAVKKARGAAARSSGYAVEDAACAWLQAQGLVIVDRNVRYKFGELDIVAWQGQTLVLCEVRLRSNARFGDAATSITPTKQRRLWAAAQAYTQSMKPQPPMRIDVLAYHSVSAAPLWIHNALG